jgi:hypothetical protein
LSAVAPAIGVGLFLLAAEAAGNRLLRKRERVTV